VQTPMVLRFLPDSLRLDRTVILEVVRLNEVVVEFSGDFLQDREFLLEAVRINEFAIKYVPEHIRKEREFTIRAAQENYWVMPHIEKEFKEDRGVQRAAWRSDDASFQHALDVPEGMDNIDM